MNNFIKHYDLLDINYLDIEEYTDNNDIKNIDIQLIKEYTLNNAIVDYISTLVYQLSELYIFALHILDDNIRINHKLEYDSNLKQYTELYPVIELEYNQSKIKSGLWIHINKSIEEIYNESIPEAEITFNKLISILKIK